MCLITPHSCSAGAKINLTGPTWHPSSTPAQGLQATSVHCGILNSSNTHQPELSCSLSGRAHVFLHLKCSICLLSFESYNALMAYRNAPGFSNANKRSPKTHTHTHTPCANFPDTMRNYMTSCSCFLPQWLVWIIWMLSWSGKQPCCCFPALLLHCGTNVMHVKLYVVNDMKGFTCKVVESHVCFPPLLWF